MISGRSKWLLGAAALAPIGMIGNFAMIYHAGALVRTEQISPGEAMETMATYGPYLIKLFAVGCLFSLISIVSLIFDNRRKHESK